MSIALSILLLIFGGLTLWLLTDSAMKWYLKTLCISVFCVLTVIFWSSIHSFLGWPANNDDVPDKMLIYWVIVKPPNKITEFDGAIYFLIESTKDDKGVLQKLFGYNSDFIEPRLFELPYSRKLHEQVEKEMMPELIQGMPIMGSLKKKKGKKGNSRKGKTWAKGKQSGGSESQDQEWEYHQLRPSDFLSKPYPQ